MTGATRWCPSCRTSAGSSPPNRRIRRGAADRVLTGDGRCWPARPAPPVHTPGSGAISWPVRSMTLSIGDGGHHMPPEANVAATLDNSSIQLDGAQREGAQILPLHRGSRRGSRWYSGREARAVPGSAWDRRPSRTAMSTARETPTWAMRLANAVFGRLGQRVGDAHRAAIAAGVLDAPEVPAGSPACRWCQALALVPVERRAGVDAIPMSSAAAVVKIGRSSRRRHRANKYGCGWTVWPPPDSGHTCGCRPSPGRGARPGRAGSRSSRWRRPSAVGRRRCRPPS